MTLAGGPRLKRAYEETVAIAREFAGEDLREVEMPLAEMFGIDHGELLDFLEEFVDDIVHGTMQAMHEGKLPQETSVLGKQMMAVAVRWLAMGIVIERERNHETGLGKVPLFTDRERGSLIWALDQSVAILEREIREFPVGELGEDALVAKQRNLKSLGQAKEKLEGALEL